MATTYREQIYKAWQGRPNISGKNVSPACKNSDFKPFFRSVDKVFYKFISYLFAWRFALFASVPVGTTESFVGPISAPEL